MLATEDRTSKTKVGVRSGKIEMKQVVGKGAAREKKKLNHK